MVFWVIKINRGFLKKDGVFERTGFLKGRGFLKWTACTDLKLSGLYFLFGYGDV